MQSSAALPHPIQQALERGFTIVTANQRAARTLHRAFDLHQRARSRPFWEPPTILAWDAWLADLWHRLLLDGVATELLLSPTQEHTLWRAVIDDDAATTETVDSATGTAALSLRPIDSLAALAADAWSLLHAYRARRRLQSAVASTDTRAFARWAGEFDRRSARAKYLTEAQLPEALRAAIEAGRLIPPTGLLLVGFDLKTPAQSALLDAIADAGSAIQEFSPQIAAVSSIALAPRSLESAECGPAATLTLVAAPDERAELAACARWLRAHLIDRPTARIAVVVPAIETDRAEIDRIFRQALAPELNRIAAPANSDPFEFSLGIPLANTPIVATALDILRWAAGSLPLDRVSALLLSPHFAADTSHANGEHLARAEFDAFVLRQQPLLQPRISLDALLTLASNPKHGAATLPNLLQHLSALRPLFLQRGLLTAERTHAEWAATFHEILDAAGSAAPGRDSSVEFQARRKWESALDELTTLDFGSRSDGTRVRFAAALDALERICAQTLFAPESRHAPIQIMGPLESAGSTFDALWFLRASDLAWPSKPTPNPLLPWLLQRDLAMPGANPTHDAAHARNITQRIAACAPTVLFSYAQQTVDGSQRPSSVVTALAASGLTLDLRTAEEIAPCESAPAPIALEAIPDDAPIPPPPDRTLRGGASILAAQAACGFRAFAEKRLFSSALEPSTFGLDPRQRGSLVHATLESFWSHVETQAALQLLAIEERDGILSHCIDAAIARHLPNPAPGWPRAYLLAERQRLLNLLRSWLDFEATERMPFTVKSCEEMLRDVQIGPLRIEIRVDRIDTIQLPAAPDEDTPEEVSSANNPLSGEIILDYKTGPASTADWLGDRPDAPQLPLYAVVSEVPNLAAIAFASVRPGKDLGLLGYQSRDGLLPKAAKLKTESLAAQVEQWRAVLTALAEDFHSGNARVDPKHYPKTCEHCDQRLLCRLNPATLDAASDEDSDTDDSIPTAQEAARG